MRTQHAALECNAGRISAFVVAVHVGSTARTSEGIHLNQTQKKHQFDAQVLATVHLLRERIRTLEEGMSSKDKALAQQADRVQGLQGSLERAQAALHAAGKDTQPAGAEALHRQHSLEARLAHEQVSSPTPPCCLPLQNMLVQLGSL